MTKPQETKEKNLNEPGLAWFCLRSHLKHEHIAAAHLRKLENIEVFVPRIRFKRIKRNGTAWVTEALFPNYLFARFDWTRSLRQIYYSPGVSDVVHFGSNWPVIPDQAIQDLRATLGENEIHVIPAEVCAGDSVQIVGGSFHGLHAVVERVLPSARRVAVLMDFLGRQASVEVELGMVIKDKEARAAIGLDIATKPER